jgi:hypothetical protein
VALAGITLDDDYRARMLPVVAALEKGSPVPTYQPARHSLVARLPRTWTEPRAQQLVQLVHDSGLAGVVSVAALRRWPDLAHVTLAMLEVEPGPGAVVGSAPLRAHFEGLFLGARRTVGRGYLVVRLPGPDAGRLARLRASLGDRAGRPLMGGVLHLLREVAPGGAEAHALAHLLRAADGLLHDAVELVDFVWSATHDDMVLTARQRPAVARRPTDGADHHDGDHA